MVSTRQIMQLLQEQSFKCALSGRALTPETAVLDHKAARSDGGSDEKENLQAIHVTVNKMKHTMGNEEFIALCREVVESADSLILRPVS